MANTPMIAGKAEVAFAGHRIRRKILLSLVLGSAIPLLVLTYALYAQIVPLLHPVDHRLLIVGLQVLIILVGLVMAAGGYVIWDVTTAVARMAEFISTSKQFEALNGRRDEIGVLMSSFSRMLTTIEAQAAEINSFAARLDHAYKELEASNSRLKEFSFKDDVTGLYNRRFFLVRLEEEVNRCRRFNHPVSVVLLDLDGYKVINDELGHAAGDETLRQVAQLLLKHSRGINVICRYGGDEFAVLLVETSKGGARLYADRIRQVLATHPFPHGRQVTASFGVASLPEDVTPVTEDLIGAADDALYAAKRGGKNRVEGYEAHFEHKAPESRERVY
ncbi:MAG: diguanylate cyclase [Candidatus Rokubacteria bacterium]|nr:diguanylate cyclase [Candidatus Rokubacteria bacterium]